MDDSAKPSPIVVGVDGSTLSARALDWAVEEARRRGRALWLICAWEMDYAAGMFGTLIPLLQQECEQILARARQQVAARDPELRVTTATVQGQPAAALIEASGRACLVVVGSRGLGSLQGALAGSTSMAVAAHAHCPVVVVHEQVQAGELAGRVVVGLDGSEGSGEALRFAFEQANDRGLGVSVVHAWGVTFLEGVFALGGLIEGLEDLRREQEAMTSQWVAPWRERFPSVEVEIMVTQARPVDALVEASREAHLLVVGTRGHGGFTRLLLGSVTRGVLHRAGCPVAVIRALHDAHRDVELSEAG